MPDEEKLQDKLVTYIEDAYAMEHQIMEALQKQVNLTKDFPNVQARIREHLAATEQHQQRMESRLKAYNKTPSGLKSAISNLMGNTMGMMAGTRTDPLAMTARDDYVIEHMEIASYAFLITLARVAGDEETVRACELNLRDEIEMQSWLAQHLPEAALLSLQQDGITIPQQGWDLAQHAQSTGISSVITSTDTQAAAAQY
jgi:ferritin-like metal-binding protein YciE